MGAEENYGSDLLKLAVAKGYIIRHEPEILEYFELVVDAVIMDGVVQQQLKADREFEEPPGEEVLLNRPDGNRVSRDGVVSLSRRNTEG